MNPPSFADRMLAVAWQVAAAIVTDPLASLGLGMALLAGLVAVLLTWRVAVCAWRSLCRWVRTARRSFSGSVDQPTTPQAWDEVDALNEIYRMPPALGHPLPRRRAGVRFPGRPLRRRTERLPRRSPK